MGHVYFECVAFGGGARIHGNHIKLKVRTFMISSILEYSICEKID